jgi:thiol-disulfide isomerase/thioredoxin
MRAAPLVLVVLLAACTVSSAPGVGMSLAHQRLREPGGQGFVTLERYQGKVLVIDFWASWCVACKHGVPRLTRLQAAYGERLVVLGVNAGETESRALAGVRAFGIDYPVALDPDLELSDSVGASELPLVIVVDQAGIIRARARELDAPTLAIIDDLLR